MLCRLGEKQQEWKQAIELAQLMRTNPHVCLVANLVNSNYNIEVALLWFKKFDTFILENNLFSPNVFVQNIMGDILFVYILCEVTYILRFTVKP